MKRRSEMTAMVPTPVPPEAHPVGVLSALLRHSRMQELAARQGGGMPIAITAAVARPWIIDPHDTIGNHCRMNSHQSLFKQLCLPLAQADRSLPP
jgi:hypothetical protein